MRIQTTAVLTLCCSSATSFSINHLPSPSILSLNNIHQHPPSFQLYGRKRGGLTQEDFSSLNDSDNGNNGTIKSSSSGKKRNKKDAKVQVSSSLSQWAATLGGENDDAMTSSSYSRSVESSSKGSESTAATTTFAPFEADEVETTTATTTTKLKKKKKSSKNNDNNTRRERLEQNQKLTQEYNQKVQSVLSSIEEIITSNNFDVQPLLSYIQQLITLQQDQELRMNDNSIDFESRSGSSSNDDELMSLKQLFTSKQSYDYNLAWVGSDDAICHLGTGLHKVPLARLQDIFLTLSGSNSSGAGATEMNIPKGLLKGGGKKKNKNFITVMEVIRILGPFPNVRNTLQGRVIMNESNSRKSMSMMSSTVSGSSYSSGGGRNTVQIVYDSMMDGLGKEIKAGNDDDVRMLDLNIVFANENAIVGIVPTAMDDGMDDDTSYVTKSFGKNGENVLLFLREDDIDSTLEGLRAA